MPGSWKLFWMTREPLKAGLSVKEEKQPNYLPESGQCLWIRILGGSHRVWCRSLGMSNKYLIYCSLYAAYSPHIRRISV